MTRNPAISDAPSSRIVFLDYLRFIACFMVIFVHCIEPFYLGGEGTLIRNSSDAAWSTFLDSALRAAVPLFMMASSYLLFPLKYDTRTFFFNPHAGHLWFIYMLLGVYLLMPLLSPWIEKVSKKGEEAFLCLWGVTTLIPFFRQAATALTGSPELWGEAGWNEYGTLYYVSGFIGYLVLGHYFRTYLGDWSWKKTLAVAVPLWIAGYAVTAGWFWAMMPKEFPVSGPIGLAMYMETSWQFCAFGVALTAIAYFLVIRKMTDDGWFYRNVILPVSKVSYGVYLMHMFILTFFNQTVSGWGLCTPLHIVVTACLTFVTASVLSRLLSFIPGSKYVLG